jgi:hypothetical protein
VVSVPLKSNITNEMLQQVLADRTAGSKDPALQISVRS